MALVDGKRLVTDDVRRAVLFGAEDPDSLFWPDIERAMIPAAQEIFVRGDAYPVSFAHICFFLEQVRRAA